MKRIHAAAAALLLGAAPLAAAGRAFQVRTFTAARSSDSVGDRDAATGDFWLAQGDYDNATGGQIPKLVRLTTGGATTTWQLSLTPDSYAPIAAKRAPAGAVWTLVPLFSEGAAALYRLDPASNTVSRYPVSFVGTSLQLDPVDGTAWVTGTGKIAHLAANDRWTTWDVPNFAGGSTRFDASRRIWLEADNGTLRSFAVDAGRLEIWADAGVAMRALDLDAQGRVWGISGDQTLLVCLEPGPRVKTSFALAFTAANWAGIGAGSGGLVPVVSAYGPHVLFHDPASMTDGAAATLATPQASTPPSAETPAMRTSRDAAPTAATGSFYDRIVYAEADDGRMLYQLDGIGFSSLVWTDGRQALVGSSPLLWFQPVTGTFTTQAVLPAVVEVRPDDPTNNFLTEITVANRDADFAVTLRFQTADAVYTAGVNLPAGTTTTLNGVQALRELGAPTIPAGASGTLTAIFTNGSGRMSARVYTKFANAAVFPIGSTTGLAFSSVDPARKLSVYRTTLNGLKNTADFRTNISVANVCGALAPTVCPTLSLTATFNDDATGTRLGEVDLQVPPGQLRQLNAPLASFPGATGETFSVELQPYGAGVTGYDAYATVISNSVQDAAFIRASAVVNSSTPTLPVAVDSSGAGGARFVSEAAITSMDSVPSVADVTFTSATSGNTVTEVLNLQPGRGVRWANAVDHFRQIAPDRVAANDYGPVRFAFRQFARGFASSRTTAANGTGLAFVAVDPFIERATRTKRIFGLREDGAFRTNLAVVHLGATTDNAAASIGVKVTLRDSSGAPVGSPLTATLAPGQLRQWNRILSESFGLAGSGYGVTIERTSGHDAFDAYVTTIDNVTTDSSFLRAE